MSAAQAAVAATVAVERVAGRAEATGAPRSPGLPVAAREAAADPEVREAPMGTAAATAALRGAAAAVEPLVAAVVLAVWTRAVVGLVAAATAPREAAMAAGSTAPAAVEVAAVRAALAVVVGEGAGRVEGMATAVLMVAPGGGWGSEGEGGVVEKASGVRAWAGAATAVTAREAAEAMAAATTAGAGTAVGMAASVARAEKEGVAV